MIYFSFGSLVKLSSIPDHVMKVIKEVLAQVPQKVLIKYEGEMKDKPKNVMLSKWFPQRDILCMVDKNTHMNFIYYSLTNLNIFF